MIRLEDVDEKNWRIPLSVLDEQKQYVVNGTTISFLMKIFSNIQVFAYLNVREKLEIT